jgi:hypothetical protein
MPTIALDLDRVRADLHKLETELIELQQSITSKQATARDLRDLITIAERLYPQQPLEAEAPSEGDAVSSPPDNGAGSLASLTTEGAALAALQLGGVWSPSDLARVMLQRGWTTTSESPEAIVSGALVRLMKSHPYEVIKEGYGKYAFRPKGAPSIPESAQGGEDA